MSMEYVSISLCLLQFLPEVLYFDALKSILFFLMAWLFEILPGSFFPFLSVVDRIIVPKDVDNVQIYYFAWKKTLQMWLSEKSWDGKKILGYAGGPSVITRVLYYKERGKQESESWRRYNDRSTSQGERERDLKMLCCWLQAKEFMWPLEAGKGKKQDSFLEPSEGT